MFVSGEFPIVHHGLRMFQPFSPDTQYIPDMISSLHLESRHNYCSFHYSYNDIGLHMYYLSCVNMHDFWIENVIYSYGSAGRI